jgi:pimeloyl-ACP methyl ester carboxylesterase
MFESYAKLGPTSYIPPFQSSSPSSPSSPSDNVIICLHGFDSNSFEYRRLHPLLSALHTAYCVDISGWGFTDLSAGSSTAATKTENVKNFVLSLCEKEGYEPSNVVMCGASLGATVAMEVTLALGLRRWIALDGQCFVDGVGPTPPKLLLGLGVEVLRSRWLRTLANKISYKDVTLGDEDAIEVGCMHTRREGWKEGIVGKMRCANRLIVVDLFVM